MPDAIKHQITALNAQIADLRTEVLEAANSRVQQLEIKNETLERELADMRKDAKAVSTALIPVAYALEVRIIPYINERTYLTATSGNNSVPYQGVLLPWKKLELTVLMSCWTRHR